MIHLQKFCSLFSASQWIIFFFIRLPLNFVVVALYYYLFVLFMMCVQTERKKLFIYISVGQMRMFRHEVKKCVLTHSVWDGQLGNDMSFFCCVWKINRRITEKGVEFQGMGIFEFLISFYLFKIKLKILNSRKA